MKELPEFPTAALPAIIAGAAYLIVRKRKASKD